MIQQMLEARASLQEHYRRADEFSRNLAQEIVNKRDTSLTVKIYTDVHSWQKAEVLAAALNISMQQMVRRCSARDRVYGQLIERSAMKEGDTTHDCLYRVKLERRQWTRIEHLAKKLDATPDQIRQWVNRRLTTPCGHMVDRRKAEGAAARFMETQYMLRHLPPRHDEWRYAYEHADRIGIDVSDFRRRVSRNGTINGVKYERREEPTNSAVRYLYKEVRR